MSIKDAPVVHGFLDGHGQLCVWCGWCCDWHHHGEAPVGSINHKGAHCYAIDGPYSMTGYQVLVHSAPAADVKAVMKRATAAQVPALYEGRTTPVLERLRAQEIPGEYLDH